MTAHPPATPQTIDNTPVYRRVVQAVCDLARRPFPELRIVDLGSAHGQFSLELAARGAQVIGIEARDPWLADARATQARRAISNVEFVQDDVRNLTRAKYGEFDIVLCLGILYHLNAPDVFEVLANVFEVCRDFTIVETHIALEPSASHEWRGRRYWGFTSQEHPPGTSDEEKLKNLGASINNEQSFWFTKASLCNVLRHVGFSSVYDCRNPMANLYIGPDRIFKIWENRITLVAMKGRPVELDAAPEADWPEKLEEHFFRPGEINFSTGFNQISLAPDDDPQ